MKYIVTKRLTDMVTGATRTERKKFADEFEAEKHVDDLHDRLLANVNVIADMFHPNAEGYLTEFSPKMQCSITLTEVAE